MNRVVVITGGAKGIGRFAAGTLLDAGEKVVIADVDAEALRRTEADFASRGELLAVKADVSREADVVAMVDDPIERFVCIDVLINNAALVSHSHMWPDPVWGAPWPVVRDMSLEFWNSVFETNVTGT